MLWWLKRYIKEGGSKTIHDCSDTILGYPRHHGEGKWSQENRVGEEIQGSGEIVSGIEMCFALL